MGGGEYLGARKLGGGEYLDYRKFVKCKLFYYTQNGSSLVLTPEGLEGKGRILNMPFLRDSNVPF